MLVGDADYIPAGLPGAELLPLADAAGYEGVVSAPPWQGRRMPLARAAMLPRIAFLSVLLSIPAWAQSQPGTTVQLPTFGVAIDADGVLAVKSFVDADPRLRAERLAQAKQRQPRDVQAASPLRKVSLVRLERALQRQLAARQPLDEPLRYLAGLQRVQYVFCLPGEHDIVVAGPAEGWVPDAAGRVVGVASGRPVLELCDLAVALRAYRPGTRQRPFVGCTISPTAEGLARLQEFQRTIPRTISQRDQARVATTLTQGTRDSLGFAEVVVYGISPRTHLAHVLLEADYRMKLMAIGLEVPPVKMTTFIGALDNPSQSALQRWWFTPNYDCLRSSADGRAVELLGQGVQLQSEEKQIQPNGQLVDTGRRPGKAAELFTTAFTKKYPEIAAASPVYAQMRNAIDLLVVAAVMCRRDYYGQTGWTAAVLGDEAQFSVETEPLPRKVQCVVNSVWRGSRLLTPSGGGVSILPDEALDASRVQDDLGSLAARRDQTVLPAGDVWWWD